MTITQVLDELGVPYDSHGDSSLVTANWVNVECPWCGRGTGKKGLGFRLDGSRPCFCWSCQWHSVGSALAEITGKSWRELRKYLSELDTSWAKTEPRPRGKLTLPKGVAPLLPAHRRYLKSRQLDPDQLASIWNVQGIGIASRLPWRIFVPFAFNGETVSWSTRSIRPDCPKGDRYRHAKPEEESVPMSSFLFGEDLAGLSVIVVEGYFDVFRIGPGALATCGLRASPAQKLRLSHYARRFICFDAEPEAQRRARKLCDELESLPGETTNIVLDSGKDAGEATEKEVRSLRRLLR